MRPRRADKDNGKPPEFKNRPAGEEVELAEKRAIAMEYRRNGHSYREIAMLMDTTVSTAYYWVQAELRALRELTVEEAEDVRDMELMRLDQMLSNLQAGITAGDPMSISTALRVGERRSKLLGLDAPTKVDQRNLNLTPEDAAKMSDDELRAVANRLAEQANGRISNAKQK
jgi:hypothetical protein